MVDDQFAWRLAAELVRIESTDPGTYEDAIEKHIKQLVERYVAALPGWLSEAIRTTEVEALPDRRDLMIRVAGTGDEPALIYSCHMDTVTLGDGWDDATPALGGVVAGDRLYGRGACDMKGGLACALAALFSLLDEAAAKGSLPRRAFALLLSVDEEDFMRGVEAAIAAGLVGADEWVVDTEPTDGQVQVAHKGRTWFEVTMTGQTAHASQPWKGADAVAAMAEVVCELRRWCAGLPEHHELGRSTVTFGQIEGGYRPYVVPDSCKLWVDMRLVPPASTASARAAVEAAIARAEERVPGNRGSYEIDGRPTAHRARPRLSPARGASFRRRGGRRPGRGRLLYRLHRHRRHRRHLRQQELHELRPRFARARPQAERVRAASRRPARPAGAHPACARHLPVARPTKRGTKKPRRPAMNCTPKLGRLK